MASQPSLRIGNRERDAVAAELREHFAQGRLTREELEQRLDAVFAAKTQADLARITHDLPHVRPDSGPLPSSRTRPYQMSAAVPAALAPVPVAAGWQDQSRHHHGHGGVLATLLAALISFVLVFQVLLVGVQWPVAGRIALLAAIFAVVRGLLRRIFRKAGARGPKRPRGRRRW